MWLFVRNCFFRYPCFILALITPKKEKFTTILDNKMNVLHQFPGSPKFSPTKGFKKGGIGVKNQGFYIVQKKGDSDVEEIEDPTLSSKQEFDDVPTSPGDEHTTTDQIDKSVDVLQEDVVEIAGIIKCIISGHVPLK